MRRDSVATIIAVVLLLMPTTLTAQKPKFEIGTTAGLNFLTSGGSDIFSIVVPGGGPTPFGGLLVSSSILHVGFFPSSNVLLEPQVGFGLVNVSGDGSDGTITNLILGFQGFWLAKGAAAGSFYVGPNLGFTIVDVSDFDSESDFALGAALGYRILPLEFMSLRFEAAYRRWFDLEINQFSGLVVFGVVIN